ncbi:MAG: hypothetical protein V4850_20390 [Myxococcota bacterium]
MKRLALILVALPLAFSTVALAQEEEATPSRPIIYQKSTELDFNEVDVNGARNGPAMKFIGETSHDGFKPLIRLRTDFNAEMDASVHDVK